MKNKLTKEEEREKKEKRRESFIILLGTVSIIGAFASLFFLTGMTSAAIGAARSNLYGVIIILSALLVWSVVVTLYSKINREKKALDIKKIIREAEK